MSRRRWENEFELRLAAAEERMRSCERAQRRDVEGVATLPEYKLLYGDLIAEGLLRAVSTLTVVRAARQAGVAPARTTSPDWRLVTRVLSYRPGEELPKTLEDRVKDLRTRATRPGADPTDRAIAAVNYLRLGSTTGEGRRRQIWSVGLPEREAARAWADPAQAHIGGLVHTWEPLRRDMLRQCIEQTGEGWPEGTCPLVPLEAVARALDDGLWAGHDRPEAATSGHGRAC